MRVIFYLNKIKYLFIFLSALGGEVGQELFGDELRPLNQHEVRA